MNVPVTYLRTAAPPQTSRVFGPRAEEHGPSEHVCPACNEPFVPGDLTVLVVLGPGPDAEARAKARAGRHYNALAVEVHLACATGSEAPDADAPPAGG